MAKKEKQEDKTGDKFFQVRVPKETWVLLKKASFTNDCSLGDVIIDLVEKSRVKLLKKFEEIEEIVEAVN